MSGVFIVLEGGDGVGKSTQASLLADWLVEKGFEVVHTFEPGDTPAGAVMRRIVLDPATRGLSDRTEALLYIADKAQHVAEVVRPALERGAIVVCDRYVDSVLAYQGAGRGLDVECVEQIARWATAELLPDLTVVLDLDPTLGLGGIAEPDRLEGAGFELHVRARQLFLDIAVRDSDRYLVLPARSDRQAIAAAIRERVAGLLSDRVGRLEP